MKMKKLIVMALCLVLLVGMLAGCSSKAPEAQQSSEPAAASNNADTASKGTVKFGLIAPLNGSNAEFGTTYQTAVAMAVDEINENGGVNGYTLAFDVYDSQGDASKSVDVCRKLCDDPDVIAILGDYSSSCCMANAPIVEEAGILM